MEDRRMADNVSGGVMWLITVRRIVCVSVCAIACFWGVIASTSAYAMQHPAGAHCVEYKTSGMAGSGSITRCYNKDGHSYEIRDQKIGVGPFKKSDKAHVITVGDYIYSVDFKRKQVTKTKNPLAGTKLNVDENTAETFFQALGYTDTGLLEEINGNECVVWEAAMLGKICITSDFITVHQSAVGSKQVAIDVRRGDPGKAEHYDPAGFGYPIVDGPDLNKILSDVRSSMRPSE